MSKLQKAGIVIFSTILTIFLSLLIMLAGMRPLLYPEIYEKAFTENNFYDAAGSRLSQLGGASDGTIFSKEEAKSNVDRILGNVLSYVRSETNELNLTIDINRESVKQYFTTVAAQLPTCQLGQNPFAGSLNCRPAGFTPEQFADIIISNSGISFKKIDLNNYLPSIKSSLDNMKRYAKIFQYALYLSIVLVIASLIAIAALARKSTNKALKAIGSAILVSGISAAFFGLTMTDLILRLTPVRDSPTFAALAATIFTEVSRPIVYMGIAAIIVGIILIVAPFVRRKRLEKK